MHSDSKMSQTHKAHMVPLPLLKKQEKHRRTSLSWRSPASDLPIFQLPTGLISAGNDVGLGLPRTFRFGILVTHQIPTETGWKNMEKYPKKKSTQKMPPQKKTIYIYIYDLKWCPGCKGTVFFQRITPTSWWFQPI